uniref:DUF7769 domain-containing protein n=1 Tax=Oryza brachyantha TaxID=4533 RepID=J3MSC0_ORYBR
MVIRPFDLNAPPDDDDGLGDEAVAGEQGGVHVTQDEDVGGEAIVVDGGVHVAPDDVEGHQQPERRARKWLTDHERYVVYITLEARYKARTFKRSSTKEIADLFHADIRVIQRIWKQARQQIGLGQDVDVSNKRKGRCGVKIIEIDYSLHTTAPRNRRCSLRSLAKILNVSVATVHKRVKLGYIRRHSNTLKPHLQENKRQRLQFCPTSLGDIIQAVHEEFEGYEVSKINRVFLTLQTCMNEVMKIQGGNRYKIPMNKDGLEREARLPSSLACSASVYERVVANLQLVE